MPKNCIKCGKQNNDKAKFCNGCGAPFTAVSDTPAPRSQTRMPKIPSKPAHADINKPSNEKPTSSLAPDVMIRAVMTGNINEVKKLSSSYPIKNKLTDKYGNNLLHIAVESGKREMVSFLLETGLNINEKNKLNESPFFIAINKGDLMMVELLALKGADINSEDTTGLTPLDLAVRRNDVDILGLLVEKGANVQKADGIGWTPAHRACFLGNLEALKILKNCGANINARDKANRTPLYYAEKEGHKDICQYLVKSGATI